MGSFGENLRREREMRGVTLEEIATATKISIRFLRALETEDFPALPSGIFTRSFIRAYAGYLGLDVEPILAEYRATAHPKEDIDFQRMAMTTPLPQRQGSRAAVLALLVAGAMLAGGYYLYRYSRRSSEPQPKTPRAQTVPPATGGSPSGEGTSLAVEPPARTSPDAVTGAGVSQKPAGTMTPTHAPSAALGLGAPRAARGEGDLTLQLAATERAWVAVVADGKTTFQRILDPHEVKTLKAKESFDVITGNAEGIILTLNGETLKPLGGRNVYKKIHLTHDDVKNPAP